MKIITTFVVIMASVKKNNYLAENPEESFRMRFSKKHAKKLVFLINAKAEKEDRSFPASIERVLIEHFKLK